MFFSSMMGGQDPSILRVWGGLIRIDLDLDILKLLYVMGNNVKWMLSSVGFLTCSKHEKSLFSKENCVPSGAGGA